MERRSALQLIAGGVIGSQLEAAQQHLATVAGSPGDYKLQFDLVDELVTWFELKGASKLSQPVSVR